MAVALLAPAYGALLADFIFTPMLQMVCPNDWKRFDLAKDMLRMLTNQFKARAV